MLETLHIQNYRLFKDLTINNLGQVNLIAGKNNTGKTALLEAIRILQNNFDQDIILNNIYLRKELDEAKAFESLTSLFGKMEMHNLGENYSFFINKIGWGILQQNNGYIKQHQGDAGMSSMQAKGINFLNYSSPQDKTAFVPFSLDAQIQINNDFWEKILFEQADKDTIVAALNIISNKKIEQIAPLSNNILLRFEDKKTEKITRYGDGSKRLLNIGLAMVNAKNSTLLIDEFEVGLHHSIQEKLWNFVFKYAKEWNIQVFVTTHSLDTVRSFYYAANQSDTYQKMANYFTLNHSDNDDIEAINYDFEELETAFLSNLEIR